MNKLSREQRRQDRLALKDEAKALVDSGIDLVFGLDPARKIELWTIGNYVVGFKENRHHFGGDFDTAWRFFVSECEDRKAFLEEQRELEQ